MSGSYRGLEATVGNVAADCNILAVLAAVKRHWSVGAICEGPLPARALNAVHVDEPGTCKDSTDRRVSNAKAAADICRTLKQSSSEVEFLQSFPKTFPTVLRVTSRPGVRADPVFSVQDRFVFEFRDVFFYLHAYHIHLKSDIFFWGLWFTQKHHWITSSKWWRLFRTMWDSKCSQ